MITDLRRVHDLATLLDYFSTNLAWDIDMDDIEDIEDILYDYKPDQYGLSEDYWANIKSANQLRPLVDNQPWGIFVIEFDSNRFEVSALRKVLSMLVPKRRNREHAVWDKKNLLFLCFWGDTDNRTVAIAHFEDKELGLPHIKVFSWEPKSEDIMVLSRYKEKLSYLSWPIDTADSDKWHDQWICAFTTVYKQNIKDSATITNELAAYAKKIKEQILSTLKVETANGYVHLLWDKFKNTLIHDMTDAQFADMYAQTIVYGLFTARCMNPDGHFDPSDAISNIPNTNPFLRNFLKDCLSQSNKNLTFDELEIDDVVVLLQNTDIQTILFDWNRQTGGGKEDPVLYFYEGFLDAYESEQKKRRGVYYTPQPVVDFIVRAVDDILISEFNIEDGLASTATKTINIKRESKRKVGEFKKEVKDKEEVPAIQILDPATGTGTFLRQTIIQIWQNFKEKHKGNPDVCKLWNEYVPKHLLPRLNGFELMMAPYAVAHMKLAMVLQETGYDFSSDERIKVFLTNSLEEPGDTNAQIKIESMFDPLATESLEANCEKKNTGINVVIGNPPYSGESANKGRYIISLMEDFKKEPGGLVKLNEKNPKWLNDDYVKFIRFAQLCIENAGTGIVAYICPHGFLNNPTFRGMRWSLLQSFNKIYIIDLHGNSNRKETCPDGSKDENVFDIQQGVCIVFLIKSLSKEKSPFIAHYDLYGLRDIKYQALNESMISKIGFEEIKADKPFFLFKKEDYNIKDIYFSGFNVYDLFPTSSVGIVTANDSVLINSNQNILCNSVKDRYVVDIDDEKVNTISYRPFDNRYIYYDNSLLERGRKKVMLNFLLGDNIGLVTARSNKSENCDHFFISKNIMEAKCGERTTQSAIFPLFIYSETIDGVKRKPNLSTPAVDNICDSLQIRFSQDRKNSSKNCFSPFDLFDFIYAVLFSPNYRDTYFGFLKIDFPRVPYPSCKETFWRMVELGRELRQLHLLESELFLNINTGFYSEGNNIPENLCYMDNKVFINNKDYFCSIPQVAWEFYIGGYQPAQKWLKDRKGRILNEEDKLHYRKIIIALTETDRIMKEIDKVFEF